MREPRICQNQDLRDWRDLQDFVSPSPRFAAIGNPANPNMDKRLPGENARREES